MKKYPRDKKAFLNNYLFKKKFYPRENLVSI